MPELFSRFLARLDQEQGYPSAPADDKRLEYLFANDIVVTATVTEEEDRLVLDAWAWDASILHPAGRSALLGSLLGLNGVAALTHGATFSLDEEDRIVLSRTLELANLAPRAYLEALDALVTQVRQLQRLILAMPPGILIAT